MRRWKLKPRILCGRMCEYGFEDGVDYVEVFPKDEDFDLIPTNEKVTLESTQNFETNSSFRIKTPTNHQLKLDMAKEIAMIQRSDAGRKIRKYFIEVEKRYKRDLLSSKAENLNIQLSDVRAYALMSAGHCSIILNSMLGVNLGIARAHSINQAEKDYEVDLSDVKKLLPAAEHTITGYNPTQLAEKLTELTGTKYNAQKVNTLLAQLGYQHKVGKSWKLTESGQKYGQAFPYERNGHSGFHVLWDKSIIPILQSA